ncbi:hypothetical protein CTAYLR_009221 [Chrysophaeum taylorii]|uniref:tRNA (guanine(46)-N(7))-methyltransferase n=1 Tax=Chrysophaeum taylorii TaxID=2483200 RepID=A0AAD7U920_9STRA|nr:hypothetical protein CTAYLR_009221 [Chrysophaeum taylorii]
MFISLRRNVVLRRASVCAEATPRKRVKRIRQHLNPLSESASRPASLEAGWFAAAFDDPTLPLTVDVGCALGGWVCEAAAADPSRNFLGLEIRPAAIEAARAKLDKLGGAGNAHFLKANANVDLRRILADAMGPIERVLFQFPDPHFKKKHHKRRVVNVELVDALADALAPDAVVYLASDVLEAADHMRAEFRAHPAFAEDTLDVDSDGWCRESPLEHPTERERAVLRGAGTTSTEPGHVFRALFSRRGAWI